MTQSAEWMTAARVLRRSGFGTTGSTVDAAVNDGDLSATIAAILDTRFADDPGARSTPIPEFRSALPPKDVSDTEAEKIRKTRQQQTKELTYWWPRRMVAIEQPIIEKLTFVWHNHFATAASPVRSPQLMAIQNERIRERCLGDFKSLAYSMLTDGAMLRWLNGNSNTAEAPNENLSREFLELFTLGHGNAYSETDIREGARALTGWVVSRDGSVTFANDRHDSEKKTVLGVTGNLDAAAFCDIALEQPGSARYIATRLWQQLAANTPPTPQTLERLVEAYGPERDLKTLTAAILGDPAVLDGQATRINGPIDWFIGLLRALRVSLEDQKTNGDVARRLKALGQLPFHPPNVGGWPNGQAWLSTAPVFLRISAATMAATNGDISLVADSPVDERIDAVGYLLGVGQWSGQTAKVLGRHRRDPVALVAAAANTPEYVTI